MKKDVVPFLIKIPCCYFIFIFFFSFFKSSFNSIYFFIYLIRLCWCKWKLKFNLSILCVWFYFADFILGSVVFGLYGLCLIIFDIFVLQIVRSFLSLFLFLLDHNNVNSIKLLFTLTTFIFKWINYSTKWNIFKKNLFT